MEILYKTDKPFRNPLLPTERRQVPVHVPGRLLGGQGETAVGKVSGHLLTVARLKSIIIP